jgi:hypothetical protein
MRVYVTRYAQELIAKKILVCLSMYKLSDLCVFICAILCIQCFTSVSVVCFLRAIVIVFARRNRDGNVSGTMSLKIHSFCTACISLRNCSFGPPFDRSTITNSNYSFVHKELVGTVPPEIFC